MSLNLGVSVLIYGGQGDQAGRSGINSSAQLLGEALAVGTYGRRARGPRGHLAQFTAHYAMSSAAGAGSAMTVWYSNLPNPDPDTDGHWVQDTVIGSLALTATTPALIVGTNKMYDWVRYKVVIGTSQGSLWLYHRAEGNIEEA